MENIAKNVYEDLCCRNPERTLAVHADLGKMIGREHADTFIPHDLFGLEPKDITEEFLKDLFNAASEIETQHFLDGTFIPKGTVISEVHGDLRFMTYHVGNKDEWQRNIRRRCQITNPLAVIMINEAWVVYYPASETPVRNHSERKDVLHLLLTSKVFKKGRTWLVKDLGQRKVLEFLVDAEDMDYLLLNEFFQAS